jgi:hypothetical protein
VLACAVTSAAIFAVVAIKEFAYASAHPYAYGPAKIIAWGAVGGALLSVAVAILVNALRGDSSRTVGSGNPPLGPSGSPREQGRGIRRYLTRNRIAVAAGVAVVLFAASPGFQGYHIARSSYDTTCVTRLLVQFCKDEHARLARQRAKREAKEANEGRLAEERECHVIAKEAEEGKRRLFGPENYYWKCLRPGTTEQALVRKWEAERGEGERGERALTEHKRAELEAEAESLKRRAKQLTEEGEHLTNEGKIPQSAEKSEESRKTKEAGEKKLEEAKG